MPVGETRPGAGLDSAGPLVFSTTGLGTLFISESNKFFSLVSVTDPEIAAVDMFSCKSTKLITNSVIPVLRV